MNKLQKSHIEALAFVKESAQAKQFESRQNAELILKRQGVGMDAFDSVLASIEALAPIDVSFHPDRLDASGETVVQSLGRTGRYTNQFETGISNGGVTAFKGGERDLWEQRLFGGAYQKTGVASAERPKYGALNLLDYWDGACPRFGCCYFRLRPSVANRCTYSFGDSSTEPSSVGTIDHFEVVLASILDAIQSTGRGLGAEHESVKSFMDRLSQGTEVQSVIDFSTPPGRNLDECIEVHVHGPLNFRKDVEYLVADGSFQDTSIGKNLVGLSTKYGFPLLWNPGFFLPTPDVPPDFRGTIMVPLANHIAKDGVLDAVKIGQAAVSLRTNPEAWLDWGSFDETLQYLKQLWHVLATFGDAKSNRTGR